MRPVTIIAAMSLNRVIGKDGGIPWKEPEDMKFFKAMTMGHVVIMGRKTWESLGKWKPLPNRVNIVISRTMLTTTPTSNHHVARTFSEALQLAECITEADVDAGEPKTFVIGGAEIYREAMPVASCVLLTVINREVEGDTYFPELGHEWSRVDRHAIYDPTPENREHFRLAFDTYVRKPS
jgi:dihydrofolate reductase